MSRILSRIRRSRGVLAVVAALMLSLVFAPPANAFIFVVPAPSFPDTVVGQTAPAALGITNASTPPESVVNPVLTTSDIELYPACTTTAMDCTGGIAEPGVYALSPTGVGMDGPTCTGTWTITPLFVETPGVSTPVPATPQTANKYHFTPPGGEGSLLLATGETCIVNFTITTLRVPTNDVAPAQPGVQTTHLAGVTAHGPTFPPPLPGMRNSGSDISTVAPVTPRLATQAAQSSPTIPGTTTDTATLSPVPPDTGAGAPPTGTITFVLYGPNDPTCALPPRSVHPGVPVNGFGNYSTAAVPITTPGTYQWVAAYSGDTNYVPSTTACGDPGEQVTFAPATQATPSAPFGQTISDGPPIGTSDAGAEVVSPATPSQAGLPVTGYPIAMLLRLAAAALLLGDGFLLMPVWRRKHRPTLRPSSRNQPRTGT